MEIIGTDVLSGVGPAGQTLLVVFRGQGGDRVTVETVKASNDVRDDESAILRAKAILTQIVAFPPPEEEASMQPEVVEVGEPVETEGGQPHAPFEAREADTPALFFREMTQSSDQEVTAGQANIYSFEYREQNGYQRTPPAQLASLDEAKAEAIRAARELLDDLDSSLGFRGTLVRVRNADGQVVYSVEVGDVEPEASPLDG